MAFSADTGMGECLVVGRKSENVTSRATFAVLKARPSNSLVGSICAARINQLIEEGNIRRLEDGPVGGTSISFGDDVIGHLIDSPLASKEGWHISRISDFSLAQAAYQLSEENRIWMPTMRKDDTLPLRLLTRERGGRSGGARNLPPLGALLSEYYSYRGWSEAGVPTKKRLIELGL